MLQYPALLELATQSLYSIGVSESFVVGRNETADVCVLDVTCSRHHFRVVRHNGLSCVEPLSAVNPTFHNGRAVMKSEPMEHGAVLQAGQTRFQFLLHPAGDSAHQLAAQSVPDDATKMGAAPAVDDGILAGVVFSLSGVMLTRASDQWRPTLPPCRRTKTTTGANRPASS